MQEYVELEQEELPSYMRDLFGHDLKCKIVVLKKSNETPNTKEEKREKISDSPNVVTAAFDENVVGENVVGDIQNYIQANRQNIKERVEGMLQIGLEDSSFEAINKFPDDDCVESISEKDHNPLSEKFARTLLATQYNCKKSATPTFCIVKNEKIYKKDEQRLVVLGGQNSSNFVISYSIHTYTTFSEEGSLTWETMKSLVRKQPRASVNYIFRRIYNLYGSEMKENEDIGEDVAAMILETSWRKAVEKEPSVTETGLKLKMQLVAGHHNSALYFLWKELKHLETYIKVLDNEEALKVGSTVISNNFIPAPELAEDIHDLATNPIKRRKNPIGDLEVNDLRELTVLDRLWCILIRCKDLIDLKNSLSTFFRVAKIDNLLERDRAVELVKDLDIEDYVANLTLAESLKFLVAIGCEKLMKDHFAIVRFYNPVPLVGLEKIWSEYCHFENPKVSARKSLGPKQPKFFSLTDTTFNKKKLVFLRDIHNASEYVIFLKSSISKTVTLTQENFARVSKRVYQKFLSSKDDHSKPMCPNITTITCDLDSRNEELYNERSPVKKIYEIHHQLYSNKIDKDESVCSILVSLTPIFPECICDYSCNKGTGGSNIDSKQGQEHFIAILRKTKSGFS